VVIGFQEGESPQQIVQSFPTLTLAQVYGAIAYYLENEKMISGRPLPRACALANRPSTFWMWKLAACEE
jgi:hypothetical protein